MAGAEPGTLKASGSSRREDCRALGDAGDWSVRLLDQPAHTSTAQRQNGCAVQSARQAALKPCGIRSAIRSVGQSPLDAAVVKDILNVLWQVALHAQRVAARHKLPARTHVTRWEWWL